MFVVFAVLCVIAIVVFKIMRSQKSSSIEQRIQAEQSRRKTKGQDPLDAGEISTLRNRNAFPVPAFIDKLLLIGAAVFLVVGVFNKVFFYAQPGYLYHVTTIAGTESVATRVGWHMHGFGKYIPWKQAVTIQARSDDEADDNDVKTSSNLEPVTLMFLDQVSADSSAMVRFRLPTDEETFLEMAHNYRTPSNLMNSVMLPAFQETLNATASLMTAEEYYSGGRTEFTNEFRDQIRNGIFVVKRREYITETGKGATASANASIESQQDYGDRSKVVYVVEKVLDEAGQPIRKRQSFTEYGLVVDDARVTNMVPNKKFRDRMEQKQQASADRAIAREKRIQEEEQRLLAIAEGDRKIAERQAESKVKQIERTTDAETAKQLALTKASQQMEQAEIDKKTSEIKLAQARIDAQSVKVTADAAAYERRKKIESDNGLKVKIDALVQMNKDNAEALAKRNVPQTVIYSGANGAEGLGSNFEVQQIATTQMLKNLNALDLDIGVKRGK
jgi:hypothetical protein